MISFSGERPHGNVENYLKLMTTYWAGLGGIYLNTFEMFYLYTLNPIFRFFLVSCVLLGVIASYLCIKTDRNDLRFIIITAIAIFISTLTIGWTDEIHSKAIQNLSLF